MSSVKPIAIKASLSTKTTRGLSQGGGSYRGRTISLKKMTQAGRSAASPSSSAESSSFASNSVAPVLLDSESPSAVIPAPSQEEQEQNQAQNAGGNNSTLNEMAVDSESAPLLPTSPIDIVPAAEGIAETDRPVWVAPPPQHSRADREASYRFGASVAWKLGCLFGFSAATVSMIGYLNLPNSTLVAYTMPFSIAIGNMIVHAMLLLIVSVRLGAYRAANYHHTNPTLLHSNPVSKMRIHAPMVFVFFGTVGFSGGILTGLFIDDYSLGGFWPFIPAGAVSLALAWLSLLYI